LGVKEPSKLKKLLNALDMVRNMGRYIFVVLKWDQLHLLNLMDVPNIFNLDLLRFSNDKRELILKDVYEP
jgi:hypothetical protein